MGTNEAGRAVVQRNTAAPPHGHIWKKPLSGKGSTRQLLLVIKKTKRPSTTKKFLVHTPASGYQSKASAQKIFELNRPQDADNPQPIITISSIVELPTCRSETYDMAPQTRSAARPSPGRMTRNSIYGRPPPSPPKPRKSAINNPIAQSAPTHDTGVQAQDASNAQGTPWLACRDPYGVFTTVTMSETGEGVHIRWYYPEEDCEVDEDEEPDAAMIIDEERDATPAPSAGPSGAGRRPFPQTPMALHPYDAGSVILTPVKKSRPLVRSPGHIGDKGIRCLYEKEGVLRELNGGVRVVLRHPVGTSANLSREQVELLEDEREGRIVQVQVEKLLEQKRRLQAEEEQFSDSGYEDEMETDAPSQQRGLQREGTDETIRVTPRESSGVVPSTSVEEVESALGFFKGPNGELLDHHGRQILGKEGTILLHTAHRSPRRIRREEAFLGSINHYSVSDYAEDGLRRPRLGREGTELID